MGAQKTTLKDGNSVEKIERWVFEKQDGFRVNKLIQKAGPQNVALSRQDGNRTKIEKKFLLIYKITKLFQIVDPPTSEFTKSHDFLNSFYF